MEEITVLDGGLATELEKHGFEINNDPLWSARVLHDDPGAILNVHKSYLNSGAEILTTASYQASIEGFQKHLNISEAESIFLLKQSVKIAQDAREEYINDNKSEKGNLDILIAGSVGPFGACLGDGSEYTGNYCENMTHEELVSWHRRRIQCLVDAGVDLIAMETIPAAKEGIALMKLLHEFSGVRSWLSFSCQSLDKTAHDESIGKTVKNCLKVAPAGQLISVGVNCCPPDYVECLLKDISVEVHGFPLIAYPNSGEKWTPEKQWNGNKLESISTYIDRWMLFSVKIIGGCCRTSPKDIAEIVQKIKC